MAYFYFITTTSEYRTVSSPNISSRTSISSSVQRFFSFLPLVSVLRILFFSGFSRPFFATCDALFTCSAIFTALTSQRTLKMQDHEHALWQTPLYKTTAGSDKLDGTGTPKRFLVYTRERKPRSEYGTNFYPIRS